MLISWGAPFAEEALWQEVVSLARAGFIGLCNVIQKLAFVQTEQDGILSVQELS